MNRKRSVTIRGHRTSFSLEDEFWDLLTRIAADRDMPLSRLVSEIDRNRDLDHNLSSATRLYVLKWALSDRKDD
ncbi:MAG: ribbon-helix-helix domain-containing protein [Pseudomonadota bacterium]